MLAINLLQQRMETVTMNLVDIVTKTITNFWNMSSASAAIHSTATRVK